MATSTTTPPPAAGRIEGHVFLDSNGNGQQDHGETGGLAGVHIALTRPDGRPGRLVWVRRADPR